MQSSSLSMRWAQVVCDGRTAPVSGISKINLRWACDHLHLSVSPASDISQDAYFAICSCTYPESAVYPKVLTLVTHLTSARCGAHLIPWLTAIESPSACIAAADAMSWCPQHCCLHTVLTTMTCQDMALSTDASEDVSRQNCARQPKSQHLGCGEGLGFCCGLWWLGRHHHVVMCAASRCGQDQDTNSVPSKNMTTSC